MRIITLQEVQYLAHHLAEETMNWDEPIPPFKTRFPNSLESCIATPFMEYAGKELYPGLIKKAAILFYLMIKNHPFENGNKRIAMTTLFTFLFLNDKWLTVDNQELYNFAKWVASSPPKLKEATVDAVEKFISLYIANRGKN